MRNRIVSVLAAALAVAAAMTAAAPGAGAARQGNPSRDLLHQSGLDFYRTHGYLPLHGVANYYRAKMRAEANVRPGGPDTLGRLDRSPASGRAPSVGASWLGVNTATVTPPDANGAIGPNGYIEIVNDKMGIYSRTGTAVATGNLSALTADSANLTDPMVLWDPDTQRFYFSLLRFTGTTSISNAAMDWGFSKSANPASLTTDWCHYRTNFGWTGGNIPDYPKLGQTKDFLMIGVNFYNSINSTQSEQSQLAWMAKPQGSGTISTCPAVGATGLISNLRNADASQAFTPVPAIQTDPSSTGYVMAMSDIECPPICGSGTLLTIYAATNSGGGLQLSAPTSITVGSYSSPPSAPQKGFSKHLDTLDGRITHAVSGFDPRVGATTVWVSHTVAGGGGSQVNWYEVEAAAGAVAQSGVVAAPAYYVFNGGVSNDRTCTPTGCAHGDSMVLSATVSNATTFALDGMVSKVGAGPMSKGVLVHASPKTDNCSAFIGLTTCRWGDYSGATPDPSLALLTAAHGEVWLSQQFSNGGGLLAGSGDRTWNWEANP